ncbi:MAG: S8 family serine peptidase [Thermoguttaceae bacterium]
MSVFRKPENPIEGQKTDSVRQNLSKRFRRLEFETLESRELLSLSEWTWFEQLLDKETLQQQVVPGPAEPQFFRQFVESSSTVYKDRPVLDYQWIVQLSQELLQSVHNVREASEYLAPFGLTVGSGLGLEGLLLVQIIGCSFEQQNELLRSIDCFEFWEPNGWVSVDSTQSEGVNQGGGSSESINREGVKDVVNDPYAKDLWGLDTIDVETAWKTSTGKGVVVAVLDTGIDLTHPDLINALWVNPGEIVGNKVDDDRNGYVDDVNGWNFFSNSNNVMDDQHHGTHVSGIIAATMNNHEGGVGVAPDAKIMTCKVMSPDGAGGAVGSDADIITAINYVTMMKTSKGVNVSVINASFGGPDSYPAYRNALQSAGNAGIVFVAAAGNYSSNNDTKPFYPAYYSTQLSNVISVAATDSSGHLADFSNYGVKSVDLAAPGNNILSTYPVSSGNKYMYMSGTSMATPMVAGAVALLFSIHPNWTPEQMKQELFKTVEVLPSLSDKVRTGGILNVAGIGLTQSPAKPGGIEVTNRTTSSITLTWTHDMAVQSYKLEYSTDQIRWTVKELSGTQTTYTHTGLSANETVHYRLTASNRSGNSEPAVFSATTLRGGPGVPTGFYLSSRRQTTLVLAWNVALYADSYRLEYSSDNHNWQVLHEGITGTTYTHSNLTANTVYYYRLSAVNSAGSSGFVTLSATTLKEAPLTPTHFRLLESTSSSLLLGWDSVVTAETYRLEFSQDQVHWRTLSSNLTETEYLHKTDLVSETVYYYRLSAVNNGGTSPSLVIQAQTAAIVIIYPDVPENLQVRIVDKRTLELDWSIAEGANQYRIERRSSSSENFQMIAVVTEPRFLDQDVRPNALYEYRVYGRDGEQNLESPEFAAISAIIEVELPIASIDNADSLWAQEYCGTWVSARESTDPLGLGLTYLWDFRGTGEFEEYTDSSVWFSAIGLDGKPGAFQTIRLKVRDADNIESEMVEAHVAIENVFATIFCETLDSSPMSVGVPNRWDFSSIDILEDYLQEWRIDWGDGETSIHSGWILNRISVSHTYWNSGFFTITVVAIDKDSIPLTFELCATVLEQQDESNLFQTVEQVKKGDELEGQLEGTNRGETGDSGSHEFETDPLFWVEPAWSRLAVNLTSVEPAWSRIETDFFLVETGSRYELKRDTAIANLATYSGMSQSTSQQLKEGQTMFFEQWSRKGFEPDFLLTNSNEGEEIRAGEIVEVKRDPMLRKQEFVWTEPDWDLTLLAFCQDTAQLK